MFQRTNPELIPIWRNTGMDSHELLCSDYGGVGIDVSLNSAVDRETIVVKNYRNIKPEILSASDPSLPFKLPKRSDKQKCLTHNAILSLGKVGLAEDTVFLINRINSYLKMTHFKLRNDDSQQSPKVNSRLFSTQQGESPTFDEFMGVELISAERFDDTCFCVSYCDDLCYFHEISLEDLSQVTFLGSQNSGKIQTLAVNPLIYGEVVHSNHEQLFLWNIEHPEKPLIQSNLDMQYTGISFGSTPRTLIALSEKSVHLLDVRAKGGSRQLCTVEHNYYQNGNNKLYLAKQNPLHDLQCFVASTHELTVWDQRYAVQPVGVWRHYLEGLPASLSLYKSPTSEGYAVISSDESTTVIEFERSNDTSHAVGTGPPFVVSSPVDFVRMHQDLSSALSRERHGAMRASSPLIGSAAALTSCGLVVFQMNVFADTFYQLFRPRNDVDYGTSFKYGDHHEIPRQFVYAKAEEWCRACERLHSEPIQPLSDGITYPREFEFNVTGTSTTIPASISLEDTPKLMRTFIEDDAEEAPFNCDDFYRTIDESGLGDTLKSCWLTFCTSLDLQADNRQTTSIPDPLPAAGETAETVLDIPSQLPISSQASIPSQLSMSQLFVPENNESEMLDDIDHVSSFTPSRRPRKKKSLKTFSASGF